MYLLCFLITGVAGITKNNDKLPEVETTIDGKFIITYPNTNESPQHQKQQQKNETTFLPTKDETNHHPSLISNQQTSIKNLKDEKMMPIMPNIGPLTAYGHPSTRYKSINRNLKISSLSASKKSSDNTVSMPHEENIDGDSDSDPFASQRKLRPFLVPDAYAAAPIIFKSRDDSFDASTIQTLQASTVKSTVTENVEIIQTLKSVQEILETSIFPTATTPSTISTTPSTISATPSTISTTSSTISATPSTTSTTPSTTSLTISTTPSTISTTSSTISATPSTISTTSSTISATPSTISTTSSTISTTPSTISTASSTTPSTISTTPSTSIISIQDIASSPLPAITSQPHITKNNFSNNSSQNNLENDETSAELLNKENFNTEASDYDNDVFERLKDDVIEEIGDNPRSSLSESIPRPTMVHPRKSKKFFHHRQFAAPSEDGKIGEEEEVEEEDDEDIIPETAFPLPNCYRTAGGFLCCNRFLEELIYRSNSVIQQKQLSECNIHAFASHLQSEAEKMFKTTFEIIIGTGDFASKTRFKDNLICKTVTNKKVILIYGTPEPYSLSQANIPLTFN